MKDAILFGLGGLSAAIITRDLVTMLSFTEMNQGAIFKIIFFHVPVAITALLCACVALIASILFLATKQCKFDAIAVAVTEVGLAFLAAPLVTGSIWGRVIWVVWWTWDARLTSARAPWLLRTLSL